MLISDTSLHCFLLGRTTNVNSEGGCWNQKHEIQPLLSSQIHRDTDGMPRPKGLETNCVGLNCNLTGLQIVHEGTAWCEPAFTKPQSYPVLCRCSSLKIREQKQEHRASQGHKSWETTIYKDNLQDWGQRKQGQHTHNLTALPVP